MRTLNSERILAPPAPPSPIQKKEPQEIQRYRNIRFHSAFLTAGVPGCHFPPAATSATSLDLPLGPAAGAHSEGRPQPRVLEAGVTAQSRRPSPFTAAAPPLWLGAQSISQGDWTWEAGRGRKAIYPTRALGGRLAPGEDPGTKQEKVSRGLCGLSQHAWRP